MDASQFKPLEDNVIFINVEKDQKIGSIYIPDNSNSQFVEYGRVLAVGPGKISPIYPLFRIFILLTVLLTGTSYAHTGAEYGGLLVGMVILSFVVIF